MSVIAGIGVRECAAVWFVGLRVYLAIHVLAFQEERVVPGASFEMEVASNACEVVMQDRCIKTIAVVGQHVASIGEGDEVVVYAAHRYAVLQEVGFGYMMNGFRFCGDGEFSFG